MNHRTKQQDERDKAIERLRWKCLVRNKKFQECWSWLNEWKKDHSIPQPKIGDRMNDKHGDKPQILHTVLLYWLMLNNEETLDDTLFDKYWEKMREIEKNLAVYKVEDYANEISHDIDNIVNSYLTVGYPPSISDLKYNLIVRMMDGSLYLKITQRSYTIQEVDAITKEVSNLLKKRIPQKRFVKEELERYLNVYDLRNKGLKWKDICDQIYPQKVFDEQRRLSLQADIKKAKKMIEDAENNVFLGLYRLF